MYAGHFATGATVNLYFLTVSSSGEPAASTSVAIQVYRDATTERSTEGVTLTAAHGGTTGAHALQVVCTSTFYTSGDYFARVSAGTVDSKQIAGYPAGSWSIKNTNRYMNVGMWAGSTVAAVSVAGVPEVDITHIAGSTVSTAAAQVGVNVIQWTSGAVAAVNTAGVPVVDVTRWAGSTVGGLSSGAVPANVQQVNGSTAGSTATIIGISTAATIGSVNSVTTTVAANVVQWGGSTVGALSSGAVPANVQQVNGSTVGSTATVIGTSTGATITSVNSVTTTVAANVVQWGGGTPNALSSGAVPANIQQVNASTVGSTATIIGTSTGATITSVNSVTSTVSANVVSWAGSTVAAVTVAGVPEVDVTHIQGSTLGSTAMVIGAVPTATGVDLIWDEIVDGSSMTGRQSLRLANSANAGLTSGAGTTAFNIRDIDNTQNRIAATVSTGNRTAITLLVSS